MAEGISSFEKKLLPIVHTYQREYFIAVKSICMIFDS